MQSVHFMLLHKLVMLRLGRAALCSGRESLLKAHIHRCKHALAFTTDMRLGSLSGGEERRASDSAVMTDSSRARPRAAASSSAVAERPAEPARSSLMASTWHWHSGSSVSKSCVCRRCHVLKTQH